IKLVNLDWLNLQGRQSGRVKILSKKEGVLVKTPLLGVLSQHDFLVPRNEHFQRGLSPDDRFVHRMIVRDRRIMLRHAILPQRWFKCRIVFLRRRCHLRLYSWSHYPDVGLTHAISAPTRPSFEKF